MQSKAAAFFLDHPLLFSSHSTALSPKPGKCLETSLADADTVVAADDAFVAAAVSGSAAGLFGLMVAPSY